MINFQDLVPMLQVASGPVIVISGVGLLLLSMTNRLGRVIDRIRHLAALRRKAPEQRPEAISSQLKILAKRAQLIRLAIIFASVSLLLCALLVIVLFLAALLSHNAVLPIAMLFIGAMASLSLSLVLFIMDVNLSLAALEHELD
jgi:hypothetical protein